LLIQFFKKNIAFWVRCQLLLLGSMVLPPSAIAMDVESRLQASIVNRLIHFIHWPRLASNNFKIMVFDPNLKHVFDTVYHKKTFHKKPVIISLVESIDQLKGADVVYVNQPSVSQLEKLARKAHDDAFLTIGSGAGFAERGGMIQLYQVDQKIRIKINVQQTELAGLSVNSKLLKVATVVEGSH